MEDNPPNYSLEQWILIKLPIWVGKLAVKILRTIVSLPFMYMELMPSTTVAVGANIYKCYAIKVTNIGGSLAKSCFPRLLKVSDPRFIPQVISWGEDFSVSPPNAQKIDMKPNDINYFVIAWTSKKESEDGLAVANITLARRKGVNHWLWLFQPGVQEIEVDIVGDNFISKSRRYKIILSDKGHETWQALLVEGFPNGFVRMKEKITKKIKQGITRNQFHMLLAKASQPIKKSEKEKS